MLTLLSKPLFKSLARVPGFDAEEGSDYATHVWLAYALATGVHKDAKRLLRSLGLSNLLCRQEILSAIDPTDHCAVELLRGERDALEILDEYEIEYQFN